MFPERLLSDGSRWAHLRGAAAVSWLCLGSLPFSVIPEFSAAALERRVPFAVAGLF